VDPINLTADAEAFTCNVYLCPGERPALVDAGTIPGIADRIAARTDRLDAVALTHQHGDHVGELTAVLDGFEPSPDLLAHGPHPRRTRALADGDHVELGDERFEVVYTPGHAADHVAFVSDRTLFSGDAVVYADGAFSDGSFGRTDMAGQSRERLIEGLDHLLERLPEGVERMYAGHGGAFDAAEHDETVRDVIERALARAERREPKYPDD
jgi:glyoxylase-like metal-dependent hydrolase (beta-lactamase superfamily II)